MKQEMRVAALGLWLQISVSCSDNDDKAAPGEISLGPSPQMQSC